jgi:hypothetical protein
MEIVAQLVFVALVFAGILCAGFLLAIQPIWGIVDVAVDKEHSGGTKALVIVLTLLVLGPIMTFFYACFGTRSKALRRTTLIAFSVVMIAGIGAIGIAVAVPAAKRVWKSADTAVSSEQSKTAAPLSLERVSADQIVPFTALHIVPKDPSAWSVCIAEFTGYGPKADSTIPVVLPSIYPVSHLAIDPIGLAYYAITTHEVGRIIPATGRFIELETDPAIGKPSWPSAIAYDSRQGLLLIAARSQGYSFNPSTGQWKIVPGLKDDDIVALQYAPEEQVLYGLRTKPGGELATKLIKLSAGGALLGEVSLSQPIAVGRYPFPMTQLCWSGDQLIVLVSAHGPDGADRISRTNPAMYSVAPTSGVCRVVVAEGAVEAEQVPGRP